MLSSTAAQRRHLVAGGVNPRSKTEIAAEPQRGDIGSIANDDAFDIAANDCRGPHRYIVAQSDVAEYNGGRSNPVHGAVCQVVSIEQTCEATTRVDHRSKPKSRYARPMKTRVSGPDLSFALRATPQSSGFANVVATRSRRPVCRPPGASPQACVPQGATSAQPRQGA